MIFKTFILDEIRKVDMYSQRGREVQKLNQGTWCLEFRGEKWSPEDYEEGAVTNEVKIQGCKVSLDGKLNYFIKNEMKCEKWCQQEMTTLKEPSDLTA